jgi:ABC-2 type transport system permease protein
LKLAWIIARYSFRDLIKSKIITLSFLTAFIVLILTYIASEFSYGNAQKISIDFGLGASSLLSVAFSLFLGVNLVYKEIEMRTVYIALSRPVTRSAFILGKIMGMSLVLFLNILIINISSLVMYLINNGGINEVIILAILFTFIESLIVLLVVIAFSLITNQVLSVIYTIVIYVMGHAIPHVFELPFVKNNIFLEKFLVGLSYIMPNLDKINLKGYVIYNESLSLGTYVQLFSYSSIYCLGLLIIVKIIFDKKELF